MAYLFHCSEEESQHLRFINPLQSADKRTVVPQPLDTVCNILYLREGEHPSRNGQTLELELGIPLGSVRFTLLGDGSALHAADAADDVESTADRSCRILVVRQVRNEGSRVQVTSQASRRKYDRHTVFVQFLAESLDE